jgi:hypothetical protein
VREQVNVFEAGDERLNGSGGHVGDDRVGWAK